METTKELCITEGRNSTSRRGFPCEEVSVISQKLFSTLQEDGQLRLQTEHCRSPFTSQATMSPPYNLTLRTRSPQKILLAKEYSGRGGNGLLELSLSGHTLSCIRFQPVPFKSNTESRYHSQRWAAKTMVTCGNLMPLPITLFVFAVKHLLMNPWYVTFPLLMWFTQMLIETTEGYNTKSKLAQMEAAASRSQDTDLDLHPTIQFWLLTQTQISLRWLM